MYSKCTICSRVFKNTNIKLFRPPSSESKRQRWNESCGIIFTDSSRVCENHFLKSDFISAPRDPTAPRSRLMPGAVPSLLCGNALREEEIVCRTKTTKKDEAPVALNEVKEQATCEPIMETEPIPLEKVGEPATYEPIIKTRPIPLEKVNLYCRTCLTTIGLHTNGDDQKYNVHKTQDLSTWIYACTQLEVKTNDGYPKYLCQECYHKLENFYEFRATCKQSMVFLESLLSSNKSGEKDPIELEMPSTKMQLYEDKDLKAVEEISDQADCWKLEDINDISVELENIKDTSEDQKLVEIKLENYVIQENDLQQHTLTHNPKLESVETFDLENCNDEFLLDATEFLETGNCSSNDIEYCPDDDSSIDILLKNMLPTQQQQLIDETQSTNRALKFKCDICQRRCKNEFYLAAHLRAHQGIKQPFQCRHCDQTYSQMNHLRTHDRLFHKKIRKYKCSYCGQCFSKNDTLKHHEMRHTGEKPHACQICGKRFIILSGLKLHMQKIHINTQGEEETGRKYNSTRKFKCSHCELCFRSLKALQNHELKIKGEAPHKCETCGKFFRQLSHLRCHLRYHEPEDTRPKRGCRIALREEKKQQQSVVKEDQLDTRFLNLDSNDNVE